MNEKEERLNRIQKEIGVKLRKLRLGKNLKTYQLAEQAGVSQPTISQYENGNKWMRVDVLLKMLDILDASIIDIFEGLDGQESFTVDEMMMIKQLKQFMIKQRKDPNSTLSEMVDTGNQMDD